MSSESALDRSEDGQFESTVTDEDIFRVLAENGQPLGTTTVADRLGLSRTRTYEILADLESKGKVRSISVHNSTTVWELPGRWGEKSLTDVYEAEPFVEFFQSGAFPAGTDINEVASMIDEALLELNYSLGFDEGVRFKDMNRLASLFDMCVVELAQKSPNDIYNMVHDGGIEQVPTAD